MIDEPEPRRLDQLRGAGGPYGPGGAACRWRAAPATSSGEPSVQEALPANASEPSGIASIEPTKPFRSRRRFTTAGRSRSACRWSRASGGCRGSSLSIAICAACSRMRRRPEKDEPALLRHAPEEERHRHFLIESPVRVREQRRELIRVDTEGRRVMLSTWAGGKSVPDSFWAVSPSYAGAGP